MHCLIELFVESGNHLGALYTRAQVSFGGQLWRDQAPHHGFGDRMGLIENPELHHGRFHIGIRGMRCDTDDVCCLCRRFSAGGPKQAFLLPVAEYYRLCRIFLWQAAEVCHLTMIELSAQLQLDR